MNLANNVNIKNEYPPDFTKRGSLQPAFDLKSKSAP